MNIGINCAQLDTSLVGGLTTYVQGLLDGFAKCGNGHRFRLYAARRNRSFFEPFRQHPKFDVVIAEDDLLETKRRLCRAALLSHSAGFYRFTSNVLFARLRQRMDEETDILYTPTVVLQWFDGRNPDVLSMHDIQQVHYPEFFSWPRRLSRRITYGLSAAHAAYIQASSQFTKENLLAHFSEISAEQIEVIPSGVTIEKFSAPDSAEARAKYDLPERFLFFPAQLFPHKNHLTVLKALKKIENRRKLKIPLVLTGGAYGAAPKVFEFVKDQSMDYVQYLGKVPVADMAALYKDAAFMITATLHESSSLPVLEAAAAGTPVIASRIPPIEELGESLQLNLFDPLDAEGLARLICTLWNDRKTASAQAAANRLQIAQFSWENTARKYVQFFEKIVNG